MRAVIIIFMLVAIGFLGVNNTYAGNAPALEPFVVQKQKRVEFAPDFLLKNLASGDEVDFKKSYAGRVVLLHFWASWCDACEKEFPALTRLADRFNADGLSVLAIAEDSASRAGAYVRMHGLKLPVVIDGYGKAMRLYRVSLLPTSIIVDKDGKIIGRLVGGKDYDGPEAVIFFTDLLKKK